ncbi:DUF4383 domain-containing protein [Demequina sp. SO4-13]|uniref:DUF4383 domain-containing protein n=1 Tax=Demequina sp. SO4-13 TaxID=3401027 RepID=UPI003AF761E5
MVARLYARVLGIILALLAIVGFFIEDELLLDFMNVDIFLDVVRLLLAVLLIWVGFFRTSPQALNAVLGITAVSYLGVGLLGLFDRELFGLLPTGLTGFDLVFHIVLGIATVAVMLVPGRSGAGDAHTGDPRPRA